MKEVFTSSTYQGLSEQIDRFIEEHEVYSWENVTIVIGKFPDDENAVPGELQTSYHWWATLVPKDTRNTLEDLLCEEHGLVRFFFTEEDINGRVQALFEDDFIPVDELTDGQMKHVKHVLSSCDCEYGLNWDSIDGAITDLFDDDSDPDEACERDREMHGTDGYENEDMDDDSDEFHYMRANYSEEPEQ